MLEQGGAGGQSPRQTAAGAQRERCIEQKLHYRESALSAAAAVAVQLLQLDWCLMLKLVLQLKLKVQHMCCGRLLAAPAERS